MSKQLPIDWKMGKLGDLCGGSVGTRNPTLSGEGTFIYVDIASIDSNSGIISESREIANSDAPSRARKVIRTDDVIVSTIRPNLNAVAYVPESLNEQICSTGFCVLRTNPLKASSKYIYYITRTRQFIDTMVRQTKGASYPAITDNDVYGYKIPIPPLETQHKLVSILDEADNLRKLRKQADDKMKELIPALFDEMFGDPVKNPKGWPVRPLGEIVSNQDGRRKPVKAADRADRQGQYPYYGASGIIDYVDEFIFDEEALLIAEDGANLLTRSTPIAFIAKGKYWVNNHAHVVTENGLADLRYISTSLNLRDIKDYVTGSAQPKLNQASMNRILFQLPPIELQRSFSKLVGQINKETDEQSTCCNRLNDLFNSLMDRCISGKF